MIKEGSFQPSPKERELKYYKLELPL